MKRRPPLVEITSDLSAGLVSAGALLGVASVVDLVMSLCGSGALGKALRELCCGRSPRQGMREATGSHRGGGGGHHISLLP